MGSYGARVKGTVVDKHHDCQETVKTGKRQPAGPRVARLSCSHPLLPIFCFSGASCGQREEEAAWPPALLRPPKNPLCPPPYGVRFRHLRPMEGRGFSLLHYLGHHDVVFVPDRKGLGGCALGNS